MVLSYYICLQCAYHHCCGRLLAQQYACSAGTKATPREKTEDEDKGDQ